MLAPSPGTQRVEPLETSIRPEQGDWLGFAIAVFSVSLFTSPKQHGSLRLPHLPHTAVSPPSRRTVVLPPAVRMGLYKWNNRTNKN